MNNVRVIKRYANRKLYDTERSCYVTLEDLAVLIREGEEIKIIDNKSSEDLTTVTLAQIIFEAEKKLAFMPLSLLRSLIQDSGSALKDLAKGGVDVLGQKALDMRSQAKKVQRGLGEKLSSFSQEGAANEEGAVGASQKVGDLLVHTKQTFERLQRAFEDKFKGSVSNVARVASLGRDMEDIRQRLNGVEERLHSLPVGGEEAQDGSEVAKATPPSDADKAAMEILAEVQPSDA